jgi:hypothetical protein
MARIFKVILIVFFMPLLSATSCGRFAGLDENHYALSGCDGLSDTIANFAETDTWIFTKDPSSWIKCEGFSTLGLISKGKISGESFSFLARIERSTCELIIRWSAGCGRSSDEEACNWPSGQRHLEQDKIIADFIIKKQNLSLKEPGIYKRIPIEEAKKSCSFDW